MEQNGSIDKQRQNKGWENIKPYKFKPGQSGNPNGRPLKAKILTPYLEAELDKIDPNDEAGRTRGEVLAEKVVNLAMKGHSVALKEVWDRVDGKVVQEIKADVTNKNPNTIPIDLSDLTDEELGFVESIGMKIAGENKG